MKKNILAVVVLAVLVLSAVTYYYYYENSHFIKTEDAKVDGTIVKVSPQISGQILDLSFEENQVVKKGDILGRISDVNLPVGSNYDLPIIKAPISGTILKKLSSVGEIAAAGSPVAMMVDTQNLYITANIEEDELNKVKVGQKVDYTIDTFDGYKFTGQVLSIGEATNSTFSILPSSSGGNTFTKVTQRVPVKISIDDYQGLKLLPGMSAVIKLHIK